MIIDCITYGETKFDPSKFNPIENISHVKPKGGLWASPVNSKYGWKDWCKNEKFNLDQFSSSFEFTINGNVYIIDSLNDLNDLPFYQDSYDPFPYVDFEKVLKKGYDAIWLTMKGLNETEINVFGHGLYSWDCESVLIMNSKCVFSKGEKDG